MAALGKRGFPINPFLKRMEDDPDYQDPVNLREKSLISWVPYYSKGNKTTFTMYLHSSSWLDVPTCVHHRNNCVGILAVADIDWHWEHDDLGLED